MPGPAGQTQLIRSKHQTVLDKGSLLSDFIFLTPVGELPYTLMTFIDLFIPSRLKWDSGHRTHLSSNCLRSCT